MANKTDTQASPFDRFSFYDSFEEWAKKSGYEARLGRDGYEEKLLNEWRAAAKLAHDSVRDQFQPLQYHPGMGGGWTRKIVEDREHRR